MEVDNNTWDILLTHFIQVYNICMQKKSISRKSTKKNNLDCKDECSSFEQVNMLM